MRCFLAVTLALSLAFAATTAPSVQAGSPIYEPVPTAIVDPIPMPVDEPAGSSSMPGSSGMPGSAGMPASGGGTYTVALVGLAVIVLGIVLTAD